MKIIFISFFVSYIIASTGQLMAADHNECEREKDRTRTIMIYDHSHCDKIGNFCHHGAGYACLIQNRFPKNQLPSNILVHFIEKHLGDDISTLDMSMQTDLDSNIVKSLAENPRASAITFLDLSKTQAGYSGIVELLKSSTFGRLRSDQPVYESRMDTPVSVIKIEVSETRAYNQYVDGRFKYPLPLIEDFEIIYGHRRSGKLWSQMGYKQIILLCYGNELPPSDQRPMYRKNSQTLILNKLQDVFAGVHDTIDHGQAQHQRLARIDLATKSLSKTQPQPSITSLVFQYCRFEPGDYLQDLINACLYKLPNLKSISFVTVVFQAKAVEALSTLNSKFTGEINFYNCSATDSNPRHDRPTSVVLRDILPNCTVEQIIPKKFLE